MTSTENFYTNLWLNEWSDMERYNPTARHLKLIIKEVISNYGEISSLFDAGCGSGFNLEDIKKYRPNLELSGADITESIINEANIYLSDPSIKLTVLDLSKELQISPKKYDLVLCNQVLEHISNDLQAIRNLINLSNKFILITVPSGRYNETSKLVGHVRHYTLSDLMSKLNAEGVEIIRVFEWGFPFHSIYKFSLNLLPPKIQKKAGMGKYGIIKKLVSYFLYICFFLNSKKAGENIIVLGKVSPHQKELQ